MTTTSAKQIQPAQTPLHQAEQLVEQLVAGQRKANRLTLAFGLVAILATSAYFTIVYQRLSEYLDPPVMVDIAEHLLDDHLPEAREALESRLRASAPEWAATLSQRAQDAIPQVRLQVEQYALDRADQLAESAIDLTDDQLRTHLRKHQPLLQEALQDLAESPAKAESRLEELRQRFEDELDADFQEQSRELLQTVSEMNQKLAMLREGRELTPEQQLERKVLMLARRLQAEHLESAIKLSSTATAPQVR